MLIKGLKWVGKFLLYWIGAVVATTLTLVFAVAALLIVLSVVGEQAQEHGTWVWVAVPFFLFTFVAAVMATFPELKLGEKPQVGPLGKRRCLAAHTEVNQQQQYPGYISINRADDDTISITVREGGQDGARSATLIVNEDVLRHIVQDVRSQLGD